MSRPLPFHFVRIGTAFATLTLVFGWLCPSAHAATPAEIFQKKCAACHGKDGQGVATKYDAPLAGDDSIEDLARVIERTMPKDNPKSCVGEEARQVATYIYNEFYSLEARQKKGLAEPPRVELAHLTVAQYQNAVADLIGQFTPAPPDTSISQSDAQPRPQRRRPNATKRPPEPPSRVAAKPAAPRPGLYAEYFQSKGMSKTDRLFRDRIDYALDFDFGAGSPTSGMTPDQFAIVWLGSLVADDTGHYEFRLQTQNGARLYLNNDPPEERRKLRDDSDLTGQAPLIDEWVGSGGLRERTARVFLLGGRRYPLRLEFFKYMEKAASIKLEWKPPHGTWAVLDYKHLSTAAAPRIFVVDTPLPADDRSLGYERGRSVSREWHVATTNAAIAASTEVVNRLPLLAGFAKLPQESAEPTLSEKNPKRDELLRSFLSRFASVAFRRPLMTEEEEYFRSFPLTDGPNIEAAIRKAVILVLSSPNFLYTDLTPAGKSPSPHTVAGRLSFALWDSIPDAALFEAAGAGQLVTREQIESQARRMIADPRAKAKMRGFFHQWLEVDERDMVKDKALYPEFNEEVVADLRYSLEQFLDEVVWSGKSDYRQLLLSDSLVLNGRLRKLYAADQPYAPPPELPTDPDVSIDPSPEFQPVTFAPEHRAGVLTHPYLLSAFSYHNNSSPIHRGVFLTRNIVGRSLKPPPVAVSFKNEEFAPELTMREKITQVTRDSGCMSCHSVINPLGFALENFDAVGRWRTTDNKKPIDSKSQYQTFDGQSVQVQSARDIANFAAGSDSAQAAFVTQLFRHEVKQNPAAYGPGIVEKLRLKFAEDSFNMQNLMVRIAMLSALHGQNPPQPTSNSEAGP